ncbi:MAG TPA: hypothetical protein VFK39_08670 [Gemmatimonadaceae bacterium]|nr:hypothetical protein [Gemmatimonadaceae bacterium]
MAADWPWDEALDALVAAPAQHRLVFENAHVRVLDTQIAPGERTPVHTHRWPAAHYVVRGSDFVRRDAAGAVLVDTRAAGARAGGHAFTTRRVTNRGYMDADEYDDPGRLAGWLDGQRRVVLDYLERQETRHGGVSSEPSWFVAPHTSLWSVTSGARTDAIGVVIALGRITKFAADRYFRAGEEPLVAGSASHWRSPSRGGRLRVTRSSLWRSPDSR